MPRSRPQTAAARIAASEAALGIRPGATETGGKSAAIAAARLAAKSSYLDSPVVVPKSMVRSRSWFSRRSKAPAPPPEPIAAAETHQDSTPTATGKVFHQIKTLLIAASVVVIVVGAVQTAIDLLMSGEPSTMPAEPHANSRPAPTVAPARSTPTAEDTLPVPAPSDPATTGEIGGPSIFDPPSPPKPPTPSFEITGSLAPQPPQPPPALSMTPLAPSGGNNLPPSIGAGLLAAALAGEAPAAEYEIGDAFCGRPGSRPEHARSRAMVRARGQGRFRARRSSGSRASTRRATA